MNYTALLNDLKTFKDVRIATLRGQKCDEITIKSEIGKFDSKILKLKEIINSQPRRLRVLRTLNRRVPRFYKSGKVKSSRLTATAKLADAIGAEDIGKLLTTAANTSDKVKRKETIGIADDKLSAFNKQFLIVRRRERVTFIKALEKELNAIFYCRLEFRHIPSEKERQSRENTGTNCRTCDSDNCPFKIKT